MSEKRKRRGSYDLDHNLFIPKPKLLSCTQHPRKQYERILREYESLKDLAHPDVLSQYGNPATYNSIVNSNLSYQKKVNVLRPILLNFYEYWNDEFQPLQEYLSTIDSSSLSWESAGIRYNILRPLPSHLPRRDYDIYEYKLPNYKDMYYIRHRSPRKVPSTRQINEYSPSVNKISWFLMCINSNKKSITHKLRLKKFIQRLYEQIQSKPQPTQLTPTLPKYHGCISTIEGFIYR